MLQKCNSGFLACRTNLSQGRPRRIHPRVSTWQVKPWILMATPDLPKKNVENRNMLMPDHKKSWFSGKQFLTILLYLSVSIYMYCYSIHKMWCVQTMLLSLKCQKPTETCFISLAKRVKSCSPNMFHASDSTTSCCPKPASYPTGVSL